MFESKKNPNLAGWDLFPKDWKKGNTEINEI
jgi:hypothetical protein